ncbi:MAG: hypothetical protein R3A44_36755 [Caldilineaceae bacterium]
MLKNLFFSTILLLCAAVFTGCSNISLVENLREEDMNWQPSSPFFITYSALFIPTIQPALMTTFWRKTESGAMHDIILIYASPADLVAQIKKDMLLYANNEFDPFNTGFKAGIQGLDLAGPVQYYLCDNLFVTYQSTWQAGIDRAVDAALTERCGESFAGFVGDEN